MSTSAEILLPGIAVPMGHLEALIFAMSAVVTAWVACASAKLGEFLGVMDVPSGDGGHKRHQKPVPAVGGVILAMIGTLVLMVSFPWSDFPDATGRFIRFVSLAVILAAMLIGFADDRRNLSAPLRLGVSLFLLTALLLLVPKMIVRSFAFPSLGMSFDLGIMALPFTILCMLGLKYAVNMADGRHGVLLGRSLIWASFFIFHAKPHMLPTMWGVMACILVLFVFNCRGRLFMGDCGAYGIAIYFGINTLAMHSQAYGDIRSAEAVLLFFVPVIDAVRLILLRLARGQSPMSADNSHLHHLLDDALGWRRGWFVYMALVALPLVAYQLLPGRGIQIIAIAFGFYGAVIWYCTKRERFKAVLVG